MKTKSRTNTVGHKQPCRLCINPPITCERIIGKQPIVLVLDYPTILEAKKGKLLQGDTGRLIRATLRSFDIDERDVSVITALNCKPVTSKPSQLRDSMQCCRARLLRELRSLSAKYIMCLGPISYTALTSTDKIARMEKVHSRWMNVYGMKMIGTYSPTRVIMDPELFRDFYRSFDKFFNTNPEPWPNVHYWIPETVEQLYGYMHDIDAFTSAQLSCDIETTGFSPFENEILAIGFGSALGRDGDVVIITQELLADQRTWWIIADQLEFGNTIFHNGKFDLKFIIQMFKKFGIDYLFGKIGDTMLLNYCLDERPWGKYGAHSLKNISRIHYDAPDYDIEMGKWLNEYRKATDERKEEMLAELYKYLALDCYYTARLGKDLTQDVSNESEELLEFYDNLLMPASMALTDIELHGVKLDREYLESMKLKVVNDLKVSTEKIREYVQEPELNPASPKQMYKLLYNKLGLPITKTRRKGKVTDGPTSQPVIRLLRKNHPQHTELFNEIITWRRLQKTLGTYIFGLLDRIEWDDHIRCDYLLHGTSTGRLSSANPNLQNIPDESHIGFNIRTAFIPEDDDWVLIESDYSQLELRIAAHETGDKNLIKVYQRNGDLHKDMTDAAFKKQDITPYERSLAKSMVFGAVYDRGPESLAFGEEMDYIETELGGQRWSLGETKHFFTTFFNKYPLLPKWQNEQRETAYTQRVLQTELGRFKRFPLITHADNGTVGRQAINFPIQSLASDVTLDALIRIHVRLTDLNRSVGKTVAHIVLTVHDSITTTCHKKYVKRVKRIIEEEMASVPIDTVVPFKAKIAIGKNWGDCK